MRAQALVLKSRLFGGGGTASGVLGGIGSVPNACHSLCMSVVSLLSVFGVTLNILPLMFLQTYQLYLWSGALAFTGASYYFYHKQRTKINRDRNFLILNSGLLLFGLPAEALAKAGLPFSVFTDYMDFFRFIGISLAAVGIFLFFFAKKFRYVQYSVSESLQTHVNDSSTPAVSAIHLPKLTVSSALFAIVIGGFFINQYFMYRMGIFDKMGSQAGSAVTSAMKPLSRMKLTPFDIVLAKERMDKNNDGICDVCGMKIDQCISSGQLDCNMGGNQEAIGILGSQHIHADFKVYVNGQALDFAKPEYYMKSSFMHVDDNQNKEDASSVMHMHAKKVPLWLFFRGLGMNLTKDSLTLADGRVLKNENGNLLKFYLNGHKVDELGNYVFQPLDKLLISYGLENDLDIQKQINSVTNFAGNH